MTITESSSSNTVEEFQDWFEKTTFHAFKSQKFLIPTCAIMGGDGKTYVMVMNGPHKDQMMSYVRNFCKSKSAIALCLAIEAWVSQASTDDKAKINLANQIGVSMMPDRKEIVLMSFEVAGKSTIAKAWDIIRNGDQVDLKYFKEMSDGGTFSGRMNNILETSIN